MNRLLSATLVSIAVLAAGAAFAQDVDVSEPTITRGQGWSWLSGKTVGQGSTVVGGEAGWPGLSGTVLHGVAPNLDLGARLTFNYDFQGVVTEIAAGLKLNGLMRLALLENSRFNLALEFAPGPLFYFPGRFVVTGIDLPVAFVLGLPVGSTVMLNLGLDFPMYAVFSTGGGFYLPILIGGGLEYFIDQKIAVSFNTRMGPTITSNRSTAVFTLEALIGVGYRL
jgi:hypothetical protein